MNPGKVKIKEMLNKVRAGADIGPTCFRDNRAGCTAGLVCMVVFLDPFDNIHKTLLRGRDDA